MHFPPLHGSNAGCIHPEPREPEFDLSASQITFLSPYLLLTSTETQTGHRRCCAYLNNYSQSEDSVSCNHQILLPVSALHIVFVQNCYWIMRGTDADIPRAITAPWSGLLQRQRLCGCSQSYCSSIGLTYSIVILGISGKMSRNLFKAEQV